jgi:hypothetical protein
MHRLVAVTSAVSALLLARQATPDPGPAPASRNALRAQAAPACTTTWVGSVGDWADPANWSHGVPGPTDVACIGAGAQVTAGTAAPVGAGSASVAVGADLFIADFPFTLASASSTSVIGGLHLDGPAGIDGPGSIEIPTGSRWT